MKICYFGIYNPNYSRNKILLSGLKENGVEVVECRTDKRGIFKYLDLIKKHRAIKNDYDILVAGFPGNHAVVLAKFLTKKPIIFDSYLSFYDSMVFDRQAVKEKSLSAKYFWFLDWLPAKLADKILLDTKAHIKYFSQTFNVKLEKFQRIFIGAEDSIFYPRENRSNPPSQSYGEASEIFTVHFHASFIPLQGTQYIIEAANILRDENIIFQIVGKGPEFKKIQKMVADYQLDKVKLLGPVPYEQVPDYINRGDICLGIFGDTDKTGRVIPNKIYECLAMKKPVITADTPACREVFTDQKHLLFCEVANAKSLAEKILALKNNPALMATLAANGYQIYQEKFCPKVLGKDLIQFLESHYGKE